MEVESDGEGLCFPFLLPLTLDPLSPPLQTQTPNPKPKTTEFSDTAIPHDHASISVGHYLADLFMDYARSSPHKPASIEQELADLIYNTKPVFTAREIVMEASYDGPDITYFFDKQVAPHERDPEQQEKMTVA